MSSDATAGHELPIAATQPTQASPWWQLSRLANHYPALHGLRVVAVVAVVQIHVTKILVQTGIQFDALTGLASAQVWYGMDCFFILSGFLIGSLLVRDPAGIAPKRLGRFYMRRSFRIFPLYYVVLTASVLAAGLVPGQWKTLAMEYLYLTNYTSPEQPVVMDYAWSLAVEEHFYLAAPFLVAFVGLARTAPWRYTLLFLLWAAPALARWLSYPHVEHVPGGVLSLYIWTHTRADILVAGIFVAFIQRDYGVQVAAMLSHRWVRTLGVCVVLTCLAFLHLALVLGVSIRAVTALAFGTVTSVMYGLLLLWLLNYRGRVARFFARPIFLDVATLGYGIYLLHVPVLDLLVAPWSRWVVAQGAAPGLVWWAALALTMSLSALGAYALHLLVEKPMLHLRQRFAP